MPGTKFYAPAMPVYMNVAKREFTMRRHSSFIKLIQLWGILFLIALGVAVIGVDLFVNQNYFKIRADETRKNYIARQKNMIKNEVNRVVDMINHEKAQSEKLLKINIKARVYEAHSIAQHIYMKNKNSKNKSEIQAMIINALRPIRFECEKGYYFIDHLSGKNILYPVFPFFEGTNIMNLQDSKGKYVVKEEIELLEKQGEGFVTNFWPKPHCDQKQDFKKITFIKLFKPYNWSLGTGLYVDDIEKQIKTELLSHIGRIRFGKEGYVFVNHLNGETMVANGKVLPEPEKLWVVFNKYPEKMRELFDKECKAASNPEGDYIYYSFKKMSDSDNESPKVSFIRGISEWQWLVGAGVYLDDMEIGITLLHEKLNMRIQSKMFYFSVIIMGMILFFLFLFKWLNHRLTDDLNQLFSFFKSAAISDKQIELNKIRFIEFTQMGQNVNKMLKEKNRAEQNLINEKEQLFVTVRSIGDAVITTDTSGKVVLMNIVAEQLTGWKNNEAQGKPLVEIFTIVNALTRKEVKNPVVQVLESGSIVGLANHTILIAKDGVEYQISDSAAPIKNVDGDITGVVLVFRDVSNKYKMQEKISESEQRLRYALQGTQAGLWEWNVQTGEIIIDEQWADIIGYTRKELVPVSIDTWTKFIHPEDVKKSSKLFKQHFKGESDYYEFEFRMRHKKGYWVWVLDRGKVAKWTEDGKPLIMSGTHSDITKRKKAETELKNARNYISNIVDSMPSVLVGVDTDGKVTQWNKKAEQNTGISAAAAHGKIFSDVFPAISSSMEKITESMQTRKIKKELHKRHQAENKILYENLTIYPLITNGVEGAVIRIDDVTREHMLQEQLSQSRKMDAIGQIAGGVAHDFNNILSGIMGAAQLLKLPNSNLDQKNFKYVDMILQASTRAADLTSKLLTFGRNGKVSYTVLSMHNVVDDTVAILKRTIDKKVNISIKKNAENYAVIGDSSELQNALLNLGINASHAMSNGGEIKIQTRNIMLDNTYCYASPFEIEPGEYIEIEVQDTGCGIPIKNLKKIFEPFYTTKEHGKGTGLGLSTVYGTVQNHQGMVTVYSEMGKGTAFHVYIPCSKKSIQTRQINTEIVAGAGQILLVDDEEMLRSTGKYMLEKMGYQVVLAENGLEAVDIFQNQHAEIDLVIMDMVMPEMNGREAFFKIRKIDENCKVIIASGFTKNEDLDEMRKSGLAGFLNKPFTNSELSQLVSKVLLG